MITQAIQDALSSNTLDVTTIAGLVFSVFLIIYFFVAIKPGLDSKIRVNRQVQRRIERDSVNEKYQKNKIKKEFGNSIKPGDVDRIYRQLQSERFIPKKQFSAFKNGGGSIPMQKKPYRKNNVCYSKDKGYQPYLKRNTMKTAKTLNSAHNTFKKTAVRIRLKNA